MESTTSASSSTISRRRKRQNQHSAPANLFRPPSVSPDDKLKLLNKINLTEEDVRALLEGRPCENNDDIMLAEDVLEPTQQDLVAYNHRRNQIREWASQIESGGALFDEDFMRLIPSRRPEPPGLPPPPPPQNNNNQQNQHQQQHVVDNEEEERRWLEREEREAADAIARAVRRYREQGVPEDEFELILIRPRAQTNAANLTFRRICFAVLAVVTAFVCIMLQTLPLLQTSGNHRPIFDKILWDLLYVREFQKHVQHCPGLNRESSMTWTDRIFRMGFTVDCADGVLHIPAHHIIARMYEEASASNVRDALAPFVEHGVDVSWFLPCHAPPGEAVSSYYPGSVEENNTCSRSCFRGIHDGLISQKETDDALRMGALLIEAGGDHFDIHYDTALLSKWTSKILTKLRSLLLARYNVDQKGLQPVAYRVSVALPMDGAAVPIYSDKLLSLNINRTNYLNWIERTARQNDRAAYSLPPPFDRKPVRDTCNLMADLEADPNFAVHTSVFLSDGGGHEYLGGVSLYVDDHPSNANRRYKVRRGTTIDGTRGRVVVSTGGIENRRCRMPTRAGIRAVLQIWWGHKS